MRRFFLLLFIFITPVLIFSQAIDLEQQMQAGRPGADAPEAGQEEELVESQVDRLQLAISNENYPVTPGDIYRINFTAAGTLTTNQLIVESDYTINLGIFGEIDVRGTNFPQLKKRVERLIQEGYPRSLPSLTMISTGTFEVPVVGEIPRTRYVTAWGLTRLSRRVSPRSEEHTSELQSLRRI